MPFEGVPPKKTDEEIIKDVMTEANVQVPEKNETVVPDGKDEISAAVKTEEDLVKRNQSDLNKFGGVMEGEPGTLVLKDSEKNVSINSVNDLYEVVINDEDLKIFFINSDTGAEKVMKVQTYLVENGFKLGNDFAGMYEEVRVRLMDGLINPPNPFPIPAE